MLHHEIVGNGSQVLVLLHGFMESTKIWDFMEDYLSEAFKIVKIDLPGHGQSPLYHSTNTMAFMAEEVKKCTDSLGISQFHLLGHSMGGYVSLAFAEKYPESLKSLTLFFSTFLPDDEEKKEQRRKSFRIILENFKAYVNAGMPALFNPSEKVQLQDKIEIATQIALNTSPEGALAAVKGMIERENTCAILEQLEAKIILIAGQYDQAVKTEQTLKELPQRASVKSYVLDCGHNGHWEKPQICAAILNEELL
ncbi:alpha/beta fold hydrolase [Riemerella columbina]|uniref:alpha/beta fold hydrolase n=1 Tax=Riemerella columbina TaxID=103810 RepID=UPI002670389A|nr:alpha/beta fold hydrolase [Riemerella columbina]WKS95636.1 alpha/beta fold hydrolase [Riemerella columbina]